MRGTLLSTWDFAWEEIWLLVQAEPNEEGIAADVYLQGLEIPEDFEPHADLLAAIYQEAVKALRPEVLLEMGYSQIAVDAEAALRLFRDLRSTQFESEASLVNLYEGAYETIGEYDELLSRRYLALLKAFVEKYNLRYEIDDRGSLTPTIPGCFASLFEELSSACAAHGNTPNFLDDLGHAYKDLRADKSDARVRVYISRLTNLFESILSNHPDARSGLLGEASAGLRSWPHRAVQKSLASLYGFASDYPGIRHAGNSASRLRDLDMRDVVAMTVILSGYAPYLIDQLDCEDIYLPRSRKLNLAASPKASLAGGEP